MQRLSLSLIILFIVSIVFAQTPVRGKITLNVFNQEQQQVEHTTAELLRSNDSSFVKTAFSYKAGLLKIEAISFGTYMICKTLKETFP